MSASSPPNSDFDDRDAPTQTHAGGEGAGWTPRLIAGLAAIVMLLEVFSISYLMIATALPSIAAHFHTNQVAWTVTAFALTGAVVSPLVAKLALMYGKRRMLTVCVALASAGALMSAVAPTFGVLILGRAVFGFLVPCLFLSYLLIRDVFPPRTVALAISVVTSGMGLIAIPAPFLSGYLIDGFGFRSVFWFLSLATALLIVVILMLVPESDVRVHSGLDVLGAVLLGGGIAGILVAISFGPNWGWTDSGTLGFAGVGLVLLVGWVLSAKRVREPLINLAVLCRRSVILTVTASGIAYGVSGLFGTLLPTMVMVPVALNLGYGWGLSAEQFAIFQLPTTLAIVISGVLAGLFISRGTTPRVALVCGLSCSTVGFTLLAIHHGDEIGTMLLAAVVGFGQGMAYSAIPNLVVTTVEVEYQTETASIVSVAKGLISATLALVVFTILNDSFVATLAGGSPFYSYRGFTVAFTVAAVIAAIGVVLAVTLPRRNPTGSSARAETPAVDASDSETLVGSVPGTGGRPTQAG